MKWLVLLIQILPALLVLSIGGLWLAFRPPVKRNFKPYQRTHTRGYRGR